MGVITFVIAVLFSIVTIISIIWQEYRYRKLKKKFDLAIIHTVMENDSNIVEKVLETQRKLYRGGGGYAWPESAMREARRLHGLEP